MFAGVDDPDICPSNGSVSRRAPSLHGVPSERVPPLRRYHGPLRLPADQHPARLEVRLAVPALRAGLGGISQVPWEPLVRLTCSKTQAEQQHPAIHDAAARPPSPKTTSASASTTLSRLDLSTFHALRTRCLRFADLSPSRSPSDASVPSWAHARLASGWWPPLPGGIEYPLGSITKFQ